MHLQQTKRGSRESGGPQYYFHDLLPEVKRHLRKKGAVKVALVTPYGATKSDYIAVAEDKKLNTLNKPVPGQVGHDRIQQGNARESIGESIREWYRLPQGDFERIDVNIEIRDKSFYVTPLVCKYANSSKNLKLHPYTNPLTFTRMYRSPFWLKQMASVSRDIPWLVSWCKEEFQRIAKDHCKATWLPHIQETDILRASGPLKHLGMSLGGFVGKGYDCLTTFSFFNYPTYTIPVELKRNSDGFTYQMQKYGKDELSRAVLLCATQGRKVLPGHIDIIELEAFANFNLQELEKHS
jgi:hypothetical protein